ncbi:MAG TPA: dipeptide ABC transporter ATP-binding protein [Chloroflexota bacterium]
MSAPTNGTAATDGETILDVKNLEVLFPIRRGFLIERTTGHVRAVDNVSFNIKPGETLGLVGESGCGKTTTGRAVLQLQKPTGGHVYFKGQDLTTASGDDLRHLRQKMQIVFQDPFASLDPRMTVGSIIGEPLEIHGHMSAKEREEKVRELLRIVGLNPYFVNRYPHEFSGGQRQRIGVARALVLDPEFIVCDEPVSALDVSIQAQLINLLEELQDRFGLTYLFIAHDLAVVRHISNRVAVMYVGKMVELADRNSLYEMPLHPYTKALLSAVPVPDPKIEKKRQRIIMQGDVPNPANPPSGCRFHTRCPYAKPDCSETEPPLEEVQPGHYVACFYWKDILERAPNPLAVAS